MDLRGKVAVVTGVTSGIGAALARRLVSAGATVAGVARSEEKLAQAATALGSALVPVTADLASPPAVGAACDAILKRFDRVDLLVNNAAECVFEPPLALPMDAWRALFEVNVFAAIDLTKRLATRMVAGGHVVNVSSVTARFLPNERFAPYAISKRAVEEWHGAISLELQPRGIKTTLVVPGLVDTPIYAKVSGFDRTREKLKEQIPHWLAADDVADAVVWALGRPAHVVIGEMTLLPLGQAR
jgi:NAD(P)-dependent dehydrogenase (short-subunit alcohol dehydrogenase family)